MHASNVKEQPYHKKMYKRGLTNVADDRNDKNPAMLLNVSFENKHKLSSSRGRKADTRNHSRGDNREGSPNKKTVRDEESNGPSDFNKKLKMLTSRNRNSTDLHSISINSKKQMKHLDREQRTYALYMKAPYKLMDKKQQDR
jgi:hypothetical protein